MFFSNVNIYLSIFPRIWETLRSRYNFLTDKEAYAVYYTVIKHDGHLRTRGKCRRHEPQASVFYISRVFSNVRGVLSSVIHGLGFFICFMI